MASSSTGSDEPPPHKNALSKEKSPYLLQHAANPVNWYAWGPEAFAKAKAENKLIFLSIGYSTCHWCHVMEKESFEDDHIADIMNEHFINIKVDREERPDVDKVYMTYIQSAHGSGGWPMSVWLTPDLKPVYGGTYYPPTDRYFGQPGFRTVLLSIAKQWNDDKEKFQRSGTFVLDLLTKNAKITADSSATVPEIKVAIKCRQQLMDMYEHRYGGFGKQPKFPQAVNFRFLFHYYACKPTEPKRKEALDACVHTLTMMARGGIHDHIAQGFHRYSTDTKWHVPHFEKMLYDQGQLAVAYAEAYQITQDALFANVAHDILKYVDRDMSNPSGGFYSAEDADSYPEAGAHDKQEGAFCVWEKSEVCKLLDWPVQGKPDVKLHELICHRFNIVEKGNVEPFQDPHDELKHKNVLIISDPEQKLADKFGLSLDVYKEEVEKACKILFEARLKRPKPHLDDKMIAAWNGLMLSGFARAGHVFGEEKYIARAVRAAAFIQKHLYLPITDLLLRSCYKGDTGSVVQIPHPIAGFVDDYVFVVQGLLDLYEASGDAQWLEFAVKLQNVQDRLFWDKEGSAYFMTSGKDTSVLLRLKDDQDGAEPSSNSVAVLNLLRLSHLLDDPGLATKAGAVLRAYSERLSMMPAALPLMVSGVLLFHEPVKKVVIFGKRNSADTRALLSVVRSRFQPNQVVMEVNGETDAYVATHVPSTSRLKAVDGKATAYVCQGQTCSEPTIDPEKLKVLLGVTSR